MAKRPTLTSKVREVIINVIGLRKWIKEHVPQRRVTKKGNNGGSQKKASVAGRNTKKELGVNHDRSRPDNIWKTQW